MEGAWLASESPTGLEFKYWGHLAAVDKIRQPYGQVGKLDMQQQRLGIAGVGPRSFSAVANDCSSAATSARVVACAV